MNLVSYVMKVASKTITDLEFSIWLAGMRKNYVILNPPQVSQLPSRRYAETVFVKSA